MDPEIWLCNDKAVFPLSLGDQSVQWERRSLQEPEKGRNIRPSDKTAVATKSLRVGTAVAAEEGLVHTDS